MIVILKIDHHLFDSLLCADLRNSHMGNGMMIGRGGCLGLGKLEGLHGIDGVAVR